MSARGLTRKTCTTGVRALCAVPARVSSGVPTGVPTCAPSGVSLPSHAAAIAANACEVPLAHVEAGLSSHDRAMPEEVNRVLTDQVSDLLLTTCADAEENLAREDVERGKVRFVGNPMIASLWRGLASVGEEPPALERRAEAAGLPPLGVTVHRPGNVDAPGTLPPPLEGLEEAGERGAAFGELGKGDQSKLDSLGRGDAPASTVFVPGSRRCCAR